MRREDRELKAPDSPGEGEPVTTDTWVEKWVDVAGAFTGTADVEGRLSKDSTEWHVVDTVTGGTPELVEVRPLFYEVRLNTTNVASGTPAARIVGLDRRTAE